MPINHYHHDILQHIAHTRVCVCARYNVVKYRRNRRILERALEVLGDTSRENIDVIIWNISQIVNRRL